MTARILVVDDIPANVKLLEARLTAEYFDVTTAMSGAEALSICERAQCDIVLLDVMMPEMDGFETCRRLKANPATHHIPVVMVTALDQPSDRVRGLEAGADDFLTKPVSDIALLARVRSLVRLKMAADELRMRAVTSREIGINDPEFAAVQETGMAGRVLLVDDRRSSYERLAGILTTEHTVDVEPTPQEALFHAAETDYECIIVSLGLQNFDGLRLCSQVRSLDRTRGVPILMIAEAEDNARLLRGLEIGVNDYLVRPVDKNELLARVRTQIRRRRYTARLRDNVQQSMEMAITGRSHRPLQSPLHGEPSLDLGGAGRGARQAALAAGARHRLFQVDQRHPRPRRRRRRAARVRRTGEEVDPRHRSRLPLRRRGIRDRDAGDRHGGRRPGGGASIRPQDRGPSRSRSTRAPRRSDVTQSRFGLPALGRRSRTPAHDPEARRPGALSGQARRPQPVVADAA
jgi:DNA-binding response OmpR family regulator